MANGPESIAGQWGEGPLPDVAPAGEIAVSPEAERRGQALQARAALEDKARAEAAAQAQAQAQAAPQPAAMGGGAVGGMVQERGGTRLPLTPVDQMGMIGQQRQQRAQELRGQLLARRSGPNPMHGPTREYIGQARAALAGEAVASREVQAANVLQERRLATEAEMQIRETETQQAVDHAKERVRMEEQQRIMDARKDVMLRHTEAVEQLADAPDVDPDRHWASRTAGQTFAYVLGSVMLGMAGKSEVAMGMIQSAISRDIDAQKSNIGKRKQMVGARAGELEQLDVYSGLLSKYHGDERAADMAMENARLETAKRKMMQLQAESGIPGMTASGEVFIAKLDGQMAENGLQLAKMEVFNPQRRSGPALSGMGRKLALRELGQMEKSEAGVEKALLSELGEQGEASEGDLRAQKMDLAERDRVEKGMKWITSQRGGEKARYDVKLEYEIQKLLKSVREEGGLFGIGGGAWKGSEHQIALKRVVEYLGRSQSGARIADEELENFRQMVQGRFTEEQTMRNMENLLGTTQHVLQDIRRGVPDDVWKAWSRSEGGEGLAPYDERGAGGGRGELASIQPL